MFDDVEVCTDTLFLVFFCGVILRVSLCFANLVGTIPAKLLIQLTTAFREGGLRDRSGEFYYKDHLSSTTVPVLALAGDRDLICPPLAVEGRLD